MDSLFYFVTGARHFVVIAELGQTSSQPILRSRGVKNDVSNEVAISGFPSRPFSGFDSCYLVVDLWYAQMRIQVWS